MNIDICMTATIRPSIINETLKSFTSGMLSNLFTYRLIINVDPIGENIKRKKVLKICRSYFNDIIYNFPDTPGFTNAVKWCWSQTSAPYVFHLEDDWILLKPIDITSMIEILNKNQDLVSLRLNKENTGSSKQHKKHGFIYHPKISLNPTIFKGDFLRGVAPLMDLNKNPEKQLRISKTKRGKYLSKFTHGIYTKDSTRAVVYDIGRNWMNNSRYSKKTGFMYWEAKK